MESSVTKIALIDGDSLAYRAASSVEKTKYLVETTTDGLGTTLRNCEYVQAKDWKDAREIQNALKGNIWSRKEIGTLDEAKTILDSFMRRIFENVSVDYDLFLSPSSGNYRDSVATHTKYKGNRDGTVRPVYLSSLREHLRDKYGAQVAVGHEAEDEVSIKAGLLGQDGYVVVGHDKDLLQIPGDHYDWVENAHYKISSVEARKALWTQVLMGDTADNIPGCWGIGYTKAVNRVNKWIPDHEEFLFEIVVEEYEKSRKTKDCPYKDESDDQIHARVFETYWLVKLKETAEEAQWFQKNEKNKKEPLVNGKTKARSEDGKSSCAPSARETASTETCGASGATGSEQ
jgi:hypothetical protein